MNLRQTGNTEWVQEFYTGQDEWTGICREHAPLEKTMQYIAMLRHA